MKKKIITCASVSFVIILVLLSVNFLQSETDNKILRDIVKYDYLMFNKRRGMPEFLGKGVGKEKENEFKKVLMW